MMEQEQMTMRADQNTAKITAEGEIKKKKTSPRTAEKKKQAVQQQTCDNNVCPNCGTQNDPEALFCENCGTALRQNTCPNCGTELDPGLDYCENCHKYIDEQHCSFCGGAMAQADTFCTTCGCQREGILCPVCHTHSRFSFCECCAQPLTDSARREQQQAWQVNFKDELSSLEQEFEALLMTTPVGGYEDRKRLRRAEEIRDRVRALLESDPQAPVPREARVEDTERLSAAELGDRLTECRRQMQALLDRMAMPAVASGAVARNVAMARRPRLSRLGWRCNWKNALHPSPLACACPQKGGVWVVMAAGSEMEING